MLTKFRGLLSCIAFLLALGSWAIPSQRIYLSGTGFGNTKTWDFYCTSGTNSGSWKTIEVPSQWDLQGFGSYTYGWQRQPSEIGIYRTSFNAPKTWKSQSINLIFEGAMTDTEVKINGKLVGPIHQGGFYRFQYDISKFLKYDASNQLEVKVSKISANESVNRAEIDGDYWCFGGIFRPVYVEITPLSHIQRVAIDAKASGTLTMDVFLNQAQKNDVVSAQIETLNGEKVGTAFQTTISATPIDKVTLHQQVQNPKLWNAEDPNLYQIRISLLKNGTETHSMLQRFGFRTIEIRANDGFYVNGTHIILKGVNRHSHWPESGRTLNREIHLKDIATIKGMNMNAVRMSHYPPDVEFLDLCDSLGLYVFDEMAGWQKSYDTEAGSKLVKETVIRDVNHPSILVWDNGNEGGWNRELDDDFLLYDIQKREVFHPWEKFRFWDSKHYPSYNYMMNTALYNRDIILPTEFLHGLYDGGSGAGLDDFWNLFLQHSHFAGGFLWVLADEGIVRHDKNNIVDANKNYYPDGIVGPYREKEGSYYAIREIWSPIFINHRFISNEFDGKLSIENRYDFTNLNQCKFTWEMKSFSTQKTLKGSIETVDINPREKRTIELKLPNDRSDFDALYLTATDWNNHEIYTWSWPLKTAEQQLISTETKQVQAIKTEKEAHQLKIINGKEVFTLDTITGLISQIAINGKPFSMNHGPILADGNQQLAQFKSYYSGSTFKVDLNYKGQNNWMSVNWIFEPGKPAQLNYSYSIGGEHDYMGITFNYPENQVKGMKWLGNGPYRVWKNRLKGTQFGIWEKAYNNTVTGETWNYPEFKGYHSNIFWVEIQTSEGNLKVYSKTSDLFFQMLKPQKPQFAGNENTSPAFPDGDFGFMNAIAPIGTKFQTANEIGPQGEKNRMLNYEPIRGTLIFEFQNN